MNTHIGPFATRAVLTLVVSTLLIASAGPAAAGAKNFTAVLDGAQETTGPGPITTPALGNAFITVDTSTNTICISLAYTGLTSAEIATHIHGPGSFLAAAPVLEFISPGPTPLGSPKQACFPLADPNTAKLMKKGQTYLNVHTSTNPGGEIRGQILPQKGKN